MLGVFTGGTEVIVCEVIQGEPQTNEFFDEDERKKEDFSFALVEAPVRVQAGALSVEPERILSGSV